VRHDRHGLTESPNRANLYLKPAGLRQKPPDWRPQCAPQARFSSEAQGLREKILSHG
jgi:hypothetical protein